MRASLKTTKARDEVASRLVLQNENHFVNFTGATFALVTHV